MVPHLCGLSDGRVPPGHAPGATPGTVHGSGPEKPREVLHGGRAVCGSYRRHGAHRGRTDGSAPRATHQRILAQDAVQPLGHRPAGDLHRGQILEGCEVKPVFVRWDAGDVREPYRIAHNGLEFAVERIGRDCMGVAAVRSGRRPRRTNGVRSQEPGDRLLRDARATALLPSASTTSRDTFRILT